MFKNPKGIVGNLFKKGKLTSGIIVGSFAAIAIACSNAPAPAAPMQPLPAAPAPTVAPLNVEPSAPQQPMQPAPAAPAMPAPVPEPQQMMEHEEAKSIVDIAAGDERFSTLVAALQAAELDGALKGEGPFTVFAPTNDAFEKLPEGTVEALLNDIPALTDILLYHVVPGNVRASDVVVSDSAEALQGQSFAITVMDGKVMVDDAEVIITDIEAANGTIHVIDTVIIPSTEVAKNIVDVAVEDGRFTTLVAALQAAELDGALMSEGPFTVFAPTDDAFDKLPEGTVEALLNNIPALKDILMYHVVSGNFMAADVVGLESAESLQGDSFAIRVVDGKVMVNDAEVIITDISTSNGTIHVIDSVILPPEEAAKTIVDIAVEDGRFNTLVAALQAAELDGTLMGEGPFTVFAPTDDAFNKLPEGTVEALLEDIPALTNILLYHVVSGNVMAADVTGLDSAETLQGQSFSITVMDGKVMVDDAEVIITDIEAANGTIHVIDAVILPEETA